MVHCFAKEASTRKNRRIGDVECETDDELIEANEVGNAVREGLNMSWQDIPRTLEDIQGGWRDPGPELHCLPEITQQFLKKT
jgi:hypothetical protein